jgi:hypothetical protein
VFQSSYLHIRLLGVNSFARYYMNGRWANWFRCGAIDGSRFRHDALKQ